MGAVIAALVAGGCTQPVIVLQPAPIPVAIGGGALSAFGAVEGYDPRLPMLIDTGSPLTVYDDQSGVSRGHLGIIRLLSVETPEVPRLELSNVQLFTTPLRAIGFAAPFPVGAVLGGDNLSRFAIDLDYRDPPRIALSQGLNTCSCALADQCKAVFKFTPLGGNQTFSLGGDLYNYPPTRIVLDGCLEPLPDPLQPGLACANNGESCPPAGDTSTAAVECRTAQAPFLELGVSKAYAPSGVDVKLAVATGLPVVLLGASAYDRLRGQGAAAAAIAAAPLKLRLPDVRDDDANGDDINDATDGLTVAEIDLGADGKSALALVSRERYFGPCAELSRSRRQRRFPPGAPIQAPLPQNNERACLQRPDISKIPAVQRCTNGAECDDEARNPAPTAAVIELTAAIKAYVTRDTAPILVSLNADVRRGPGILGGAPTIDGIIGTEVLRRLSATIDYPGGRFIARCRTADCLAYRRYIVENECGLECIPIECTIGRRDPGRCRCTPEPPTPGGFNDGKCAALPDQHGGLCEAIP